MRVPNPAPILVFVVLACLFLFFSRRGGGLKCVLVASYCGVIITSFTGGASGAIWLAPLFLFLIGLVVIWRRREPILGTRKMARLTYAVFMTFIIGALVGLVRYDPSLEFVKAGSFTTFLGIPVQYLMMVYRLHIVAFLALAFVLPLRYYVDRELFLQCLVLCWFFTMVLVVLGLLTYFRVGNFSFSYGILERYSGAMGFGRHGHANMLVAGTFMCFAMTQLTRNHLLKMFGYASIPILIIALLFTFSRTAGVALVVGAISMAITLGGARGLKGVLISLLGAIVVYVALMRFPALRERFLFFAAGTPIGEISVARWSGWASLIKWLAKSPGILMFGAGFQNFHYFVNLLKEQLALEAAHNNFLHTLTELGILGFLVFIGWLVSIFTWLISWRRTMVDKVDKMIPGIFMSLMLGLAVSCMTSETLSPSAGMVSWQIHFYIIFGVWVSYYRVQMTELYAAENADYLTMDEW